MANFLQNSWEKIKAPVVNTTNKISSAYSQGKAANANKPAEVLYNKRGTASQFNAQYNIENFQYPSDLMGSKEQYGSNYVVFYINVALDSKLAKGPAEDYVNDFPPRDSGSLTALAKNNPNAAKIATTIGAGTAGYAGSKIISSTLGLGQGSTIAGVDASTLISGAATVGGAAAVLTSAADFTGQKKRLKTAIALHIPNQLTTRYGMNYDEETTAGMGMAIAGLGGTDAIMKAAFYTNTENLSQSGSNLSSGVAAAVLALPGTESLSKLTGLAANPRKEQVFKNVDFRTFQFAYEFYPRDAAEAEYIQNIIYQFKLHMHPEFKDANNFLYVYPSEFDIFYYHGSEENLNLNRHTSCVLTELTVNYSPQGHFSTFENGMPTQINIVMTFKELSLLTKEKIEDGL